MLDADVILSAFPSTEPDSFFDFCKALGPDCPEKGDRQQWAMLFKVLRDLEIAGLVEIERNGANIDTLMLTDEGAQRVRSLRR